nr:hypothetical protein [Oceanococcus sp. HetDA_MAG_MS8]
MLLKIYALTMVAAACFWSYSEILEAQEMLAWRQPATAPHPMQLSPLLDGRRMANVSREALYTRLDLAVQALEVALQSDPLNPDLWSLLSQGYFYSGLLDQGSMASERALQLAAGNRIIALEQGVVAADFFTTVNSSTRRLWSQNVSRLQDEVPNPFLLRLIGTKRLGKACQHFPPHANFAKACARVQRELSK